MDLSKLLIPHWDSPPPEVEIKTLDSYLTEDNLERVVYIAKGIRTFSSKDSKQRNVYIPIKNNPELIQRGLFKLFKEHRYISVILHEDFFGLSPREYLMKGIEDFPKLLKEEKRLKIASFSFFERAHFNMEIDKKLIIRVGGKFAEYHTTDGSAVLQIYRDTISSEAIPSKINEGEIEFLRGVYLKL